MAAIRLDKYLSNMGVGTRTQVKEFIRKKEVTVNGSVVTSPELKVDTELDQVCRKGQPVAFAEFEYYMLHKPAGVVTAVTDEKDRTVMDLIRGQRRKDLFPVGRLDKDTEGLLLITNDGPLCNQLLAPGKHVEKVYYARIRGFVSDPVIRQFQQGLDIGDETLTKEAGLTLIRTREPMQEDEWEAVHRHRAFLAEHPELTDSSENCSSISEIKISITEGRFHQVKRMFAAVGMEVIYLKRLSMGSLTLDSHLMCGNYRKLTKEEIEILKACGK